MRESERGGKSTGNEEEEGLEVKTMANREREGPSKQEKTKETLSKC